MCEIETSVYYPIPEKWNVFLFSIFPAVLYLLLNVSVFYLFFQTQTAWTSKKNWQICLEFYVVVVVARTAHSSCQPLNLQTDTYTNNRYDAQWYRKRRKKKKIKTPNISKSNNVTKENMIWKWKYTLRENNQRINSWSVCVFFFSFSEISQFFFRFDDGILALFKHCVSLWFMTYLFSFHSAYLSFGTFHFSHCQKKNKKKKQKQH